MLPLQILLHRDLPYIPVVRFNFINGFICELGSAHASLGSWVGRISMFRENTEISLFVRLIHPSSPFAGRRYPL